MKNVWYNWNYWVVNNEYHKLKMCGIIEIIELWITDKLIFFLNYGKPFKYLV